MFKARGMSPQISKLIWYLRNLINFMIACVRIFFYCLIHPAQAGKILFSFFSTINEFYQSSHGRLLNFEKTATFSQLQHKQIFAKSNYFNIDSQVSRPVESQVLANLAAHFQPKTVFEIGTYSGFTTLHFAYNTAPEAKIYTLDLPADHPLHQNAPHYTYDDQLVVNLSKANINQRIYQTHPCHNKIIELFGDSLTFDFSPYYQKMDLIFIDGGHSYANVSSDTENAFKMLSPKGIIIWHDFDYIIHRDVFKYLNQLAKKHNIYSIPHTRFAIYGHQDI
jgi:predicted O-methyltransferase YrrM